MQLIHGHATLKRNLLDSNGNIIRKTGEIGDITAFLPDDDVYAVMFDKRMGHG